MENRPIVKISNLKKSFSDISRETIIFDGFDLEIKKGEFIALLGPNGCGKTTLLNLISGITRIDGGEVSFTAKGEKRKPKIGYIFQNYASSLFPWLRIKDNISFPLKIRNVHPRTRIKKVKSLCRRLGVDLDLDFYPYQLSGGQQQLVAILRSLIIDPEIILMDEPFSSLDYYNELRLLQIVLKIWEKTKITTLFVSHNIEEAIFLAQKIIVFSDKPVKITKIFKNSLPYPRQIKHIGSAKFSRIKSSIVEILAKDVKMLAKET